MNKSKKEIVLFSLILMITFTLSCKDTQEQGIHFKTGDWTSVLALAKTTNKLIFVDVYTTWCGPCKWMDKNTFQDKEVANYFNAKFISYKLDAEKGEGVELSKKFRVTSFPYLLFVDKEGKLVIRQSGALDIKEMLEFGEKAIHSEKDAILMTSEYQSGNRTPEFILNYLAFLKERDLPTEDIMIRYLEDLDEEQWLLQENLNLINKYIRSPYNTVFEYLVKQRGKSNNEPYLMGYIPYATYDKYLRRIIREKSTTEEINKLLSHAKSRLNPIEIAALNFKAKIRTAKRDEDWDAYVSHYITYVNALPKDQTGGLNNYAWEFYANDNITDPKAINEALGWMNRALQSSKSYAKLDTKAALLYKLGRKEAALTAADNAVKFAEKNGDNASSTLKLIEKIKAN
ncbi:thioredoxin fold domain-containing protein [Mariniflexile sp. HMF6888]|uniref:thioredoxin family protein n=1 Tax=Mariniflexile sp. HMF6888 TaxID=3373086 RepID=UPI0037875777